MNNREILFVIRMRNQARGILKQFGVDLSQIGRQAQQATAQIGRMSRTFNTWNRGAASAGRAAQAAAGGFGSLSGALATLATYLSVRQIIQYADSYKDLHGALLLVTKSTTEAATVYQRLLDISTETRTGLEATVDLYTRVARSATQLGLSQNSLLDVTETINKAVTISRVSAETANAALIQLGQGLASNRLSGDELRSVLEQVPRLAKVIADGLGVSLGALRKLGQAGALTAAQVVKAIQSQSDVIAKEFAKVPLTVGQSLAVLNNHLLDFVGRLDTATGFTAALSKAIVFLATHLDTIATVVLPILTGVGIPLLVRWIGIAATATYSWAAALLFTPLGAVAVAIGAVVAVLVYFRDSLITVNGHTARLRDYLGVLVDKFREGFNQIKASVGGFLDALSDTKIDFAGFVAAIWNGLKFLLNVDIAIWKSIGDIVLGTMKAIAASVETTFNSLSSKLSAVMQAFVLLGKGEFSAAGQQFSDALGMSVETGLAENFGKVFTQVVANFKQDYVGKLSAEVLHALDALAVQANQRYSHGAHTAPAGDLDAHGKPTTEDATKKVKNYYQEALKGAMDQIALMKVSNNERQIEAQLIKVREQSETHNQHVTQAQLDILRQRLQVVRDLKAQESFGKSNDDDIQEMRQQIALLGATNQERERTVALTKKAQEAGAAGFRGEALRQIIADYAGVLDELQAALDRQKGSITGGLREGLQEYADKAADAFGRAKDAAGGTFKAMEDGIVSLVTKGKVSFRDLANTIIAEMLRAQAQTALGKIAGSLTQQPGVLKFVGQLLGATAHTGGLAGMTQGVKRVSPLVFAHARRYHAGGLADSGLGLGSNEVPIIAKRKEAILPTVRLPDGQFGVRAEGAMGGPSIHNEISITMQGGGGGPAADRQTAQAIAREVDRALDAKMADFYQRQSRPGGLMAPGLAF